MQSGMIEGPCPKTKHCEAHHDWCIDDTDMRQKVKRKNKIRKEELGVDYSKQTSKNDHSANKYSLKLCTDEGDYTADKWECELYR